MKFYKVREEILKIMDLPLRVFFITKKLTIKISSF